MLAFRIAFRYIFSKKSTNAINIIARVSMLGMGVGAFALIVVLSVFNGFEGLVLSLYNSFYPDLEIRAAAGKTFIEDPKITQQIMSAEEVLAVARSLEENAYFQYDEQTQLGTIKGVDEAYQQVTSVKDFVRMGTFSIYDSPHNHAVVGANIGFSMNIDVERSTEPLQITVPRKGVKNAMRPEDVFTTRMAIPDGLFSIQQEFDSKYVFVNLKFAQELLGDEQSISSYELKLKPGANIDRAKKQLQEQLGAGYKVLTRYEQKAEMYQVILIERWVTTAILAFIILIISFNIIGSLSMLVIEKKRDISILKAMGGSEKLVQRVYLLNGLMASFIGAAVGMALGYAICLLQIKFHFLLLNSGGGDSFIINHYPVELRPMDAVITIAIIGVISLIAAYFPAKKAGESVMEFK
jgi:lipoprotein-releasing system permease protein